MRTLSSWAQNWSVYDQRSIKDGAVSIEFVTWGIFRAKLYQFRPTTDDSVILSQYTVQWTFWTNFDNFTNWEALKNQILSVPAKSYVLAYILKHRVCADNPEEYELLIVLWPLLLLCLLGPTVRFYGRTIGPGARFSALKNRSFELKGSKPELFIIHYSLYYVVVPDFSAMWDVPLCIALVCIGLSLSVQCAAPMHNIAVHWVQWGIGFHPIAVCCTMLHCWVALGSVVNGVLGATAAVENWGIKSWGRQGKARLLLAFPPEWQIHLFLLENISPGY